MEHVTKYIEENKDRFLEELFELIRIPSISSESEHKNDMLKAAEKWRSFILAAGADKTGNAGCAGHQVLRFLGQDHFD